MPDLPRAAKKPMTDEEREVFIDVIGHVCTILEYGEIADMDDIILVHVTSIVPYERIYEMLCEAGLGPKREDLQ